MSTGAYLIGAIELLALVAAIGFGAVRVRGRVLAGFTGASARLAEVVIGVSMLVITLELVGVVGLYRPGWVLVAGITGGIGAGIAARRPGTRPPLVPAPPVAQYAIAIACAVAALVTAHWAMPTQVGLDIGMYLPNTTWHNAPFAARFVQEAQVGALHFTEVLTLTVWFYPQNSELLHSVGVLFLGTDFLSPLLNIGWMSLCLLAAWSFGRPFGAGAVAVLGVALVLDAEMLLLFQPGDAKNDTLGLFFLLASAAVLVNAEAGARAAADCARPLAAPSAGSGGQMTASPAAPGASGGRLRRFISGGPGLTPSFPTAAIVIAGLAAGLALGTKLNLLAPFGLLTLGVIAVVDPGRRLRTALIWSGSALATGGFWFARNLVEAGNPLPWFDAGPLPGPDQLDINIRDPHSVGDYLTNVDVIRDTFIPQLADSFGDLWPLLLATLAAGIVAAILRGQTPVVRMLGFVAAFSAVAYVFTPLTAAGPQGMPTAFDRNLRYVSPALGLGALLLAALPAIRPERVQRRVLGALGALLFFSALPLWELGDGVWRLRRIGAAVLLVALLVAAPVGLAMLRARGASLLRMLAAGVAVLAVAVGIGAYASSRYLDDRYLAETAPREYSIGMRAALAWFNREDPTDSRIAVVGGLSGFKQYTFYGKDLSNHVQYVGEQLAHGTFRPIESCRAWIAALAGGEYDYLIASPDQRNEYEYLNASGAERPARVAPIEAAWTGADPGARLLLEHDLTFVFSIDRPLDPGSCDKAPIAAKDRQG